jgi:hypothetical protein
LTAALRWFSNDRHVILAAASLLLLTLLGAVWLDEYLPMQDYPQHLFMAEVVSSYNDSRFDWRENFELRDQFGPYRATSIALQFFASFMDIQVGGKILASLYILLVGLVAYRRYRDCPNSAVPWGVLVFYPLCFQPMYFYGFLNFTLSIPVLLLALLQLRSVITGPLCWKQLGLQGLLIVALFLLHPSTFQVYIVLATASAVLLGWGGRGCILGLACAGSAAALFGVWSLSSAAMTSESGGALSLESLQLTWWPLEWTLSFLAMFFTGLRITEDPVWWVAALWVLLLPPLMFGLWRAGKKRDISPGLLWFAILSAMAMAGYFVLPFRLVTDTAYTYFNARLAPIALFLLAAFMAGLPIGARMGRLLAIVCIVLTLYSANLHHRVASELESYIPIFDQMEPNAAVLPLWTNAPAAALDPFFYTHFYSHFPFYYHVIKGGGVNPMLFDAQILPIGFKEGKRPRRILLSDIRGHHFDQYDYIMAGNVPGVAVQQLNDAAMFMDAVGPWRLYRVDKVAQGCCLSPDWREPR